MTEKELIRQYGYLITREVDKVTDAYIEEAKTSIETLCDFFEVKSHHLFRIIDEEENSVIKKYVNDNFKDKKAKEIVMKHIKAINDANDHYIEVLEVTENIRKEVEKK